MTDLLHCSEALERMPLFVGGDLEPDGLEAMRVHLAGCETCSERHGVVMRARGALVAALRDSGSPPSGMAEDSLWTGVRAALDKDGLLASPAAPESESPAPILPFRRRATLTTLAAAALLLLFTWLGNGGPDSPLQPDSSGDGLAGEGSVGTNQPHVVADVAETSDTPVFVPAAGSLRRLAPGEGTLFEEAVPLTLPVQPIGSTPNSLAGYR